MNRDKLAIEVSKILYKLYTSLNEDGKKRVYFNPSVKDINISKNCTPQSVEYLEKIINERDSIIKFVLSISYINGDDPEEEYNEKNKITVIISDDNKITLKYQYEILEDKFNTTYAQIKSFIAENSTKEIVELDIKRDKPIREMCDFGILGLYQFNKIYLDTSKEYTMAQEKNMIKKIMKKYNENLDYINKKIFTKIYNSCLFGVEGSEIWKYSFFNDIIYTEKLPDDFLSLSNSEKHKIFFGSEEIHEKDFDDIENTKLNLFNFEKIRELNRIYNVVIFPEYKTISIEMNFLRDNNATYCSPLIELDYTNFEIKNFDTGL